MPGWPPASKLGSNTDKSSPRGLGCLGFFLAYSLHIQGQHGGPDLFTAAFHTKV